MENKNHNYYIGSFEVKSGMLFVTDPCYEQSQSSRDILYNVKNGTWLAHVMRGSEGNWGIRNSELIIYHESYSCMVNEPENRTTFIVCVDSGQAGFYDVKSYPIGETGEYDGTGNFYDENCNATCDSKHHANIIRNSGVVSSSGFGDGGYDCFFSRNKDGQVVKARIVFIPKEAEQENDGDVEDDY